MACCLYVRTLVTDMWDVQTGVHSQLLYAKMRVASLEGTTIAKMELQGLVLATRSVLKVVEALDGQIARCLIIGDSMSSLMAVRRPGVAYRPYFQNRVAEVQRNLATLEDKVG